MDIFDIQKEAHATAVDRGWWDEFMYFDDNVPARATIRGRDNIHLSPCELVARIALIGTEVSEATIAHASGLLTYTEVEGKPIGVASELADIVIRAADVSHVLQCDLGQSTAARIKARIRKTMPDQLVGTTLAEMQEVRRRLQCELSGHAFTERHVPGLLLWAHTSVASAIETVRRGERPSLAPVLDTTLLLAYALEIDLTDAVARKMAYNKGRSHRHGGKAL